MQQSIYIGKRYQEGACINGSKVLIIGHQVHATKEDIDYFKGKSNWDEEFLKKNYSQNIELMNEVLLGFRGEDGKSWLGSDRKSHLRFSRIILNNDYLTGDDEDFKIFWQSVAFTNYIQVPDIDLNANYGTDIPSRYEYSKKILINYLVESMPDKVIIWGRPTFTSISSLADTVDIYDDRHFSMNVKGKKVEFLGINHPCMSGYESTRNLLKDFGLFPCNIK